ncbi:hypothetical protein NDN08_008140 [Rhodosorus marinus]|uniref:Uncharacterized protein n=1 Tax=Rhodosorus marinus TaxID=101924 RepID=A0AAV8UZI6_9RHOD|nr:hypothetical protein NDN08_008140 [Rhodosorus marinus]
MIGFVGGVAPGVKPDTQPREGVTCDGWKKRAKWKQGKDSGATMPGTLPSDIPTLQAGAGAGAGPASVSTYSPGRTAAAPSAPMDYGRAPPMGGNVTSGKSEVPLFELWKGVSEEIIEKMKAVKMESDRSVVQQHEEDISYLNTVKNKAASKLDSAARMSAIPVLDLVVKEVGKPQSSLRAAKLLVLWFSWEVLCLASLAGKPYLWSLSNVDHANMDNVAEVLKE